MAGINNFDLISLDDLNNLPRKLKKNKRIIIDLSSTKYELIKTVSSALDWQVPDKGDSKVWNIKWYDHYLYEDDLRKMLPF